MKQFLKQILRDKNGEFSIREAIIAVLLLMILISWIGQQFFRKSVPEFMFYSFTSLIAAGCFGYSLEKKTCIQNDVQSNT
jgi:choline-glycine betaine transporter